MNQPTSDDTTVFGTFTYDCHVCGAQVRVVDGWTQPHRCRVHLSQQSEDGTR